MSQDDALLEAARKGDRAALESLLERFEQPIHRFALKMCRDPEDAKEVLQESLIAAARTLRDFRGEASLSTWFYTIARSFCLKMRRRGKHAPTAVVPIEEQTLADPSRAPDEAFSGKQLEHAIDCAIEALDPGQKEVLVLRDIEGLTAPEVASVLGIGIDAVKSRLHRARVSVRSQIAPLLGGQEESAAEGCPDVATLFSRNLEGEIDAATCAAMERHLEGCPRCRGTCESLKRTLSLCKASTSSTVPASVQASVRHAVRQFLTLPPP